MSPNPRAGTLTSAAPPYKVLGTVIAATGRASRDQVQLPQAQYERGEKQRNDEVENAERQQRREQLLLAKLRKSDEHRRFDDAEAPRRMADGSEQRCNEEDDEHSGEVDRGVGRQRRYGRALRVAVGTLIAERPPHRTVRCGIPAYGSHLGCVTAKRACGQG